MSDRKTSTTYTLVATEPSGPGRVEAESPRMRDIDFLRFTYGNRG
jgi:hypothetical protein